MLINDINRSMTTLVDLSPLSPTLWQVNTDASFPNGEQIKVYIENENGNWYFTDRKNTLQYMNEIYDLKATDVKNCDIASITNGQAT